MNNNGLKNLKLERTIPRKDIKVTLDVYTHPCKAEVVRIKNNDPEKYFCAVFRTKVSDSTGVPHILEHSVLSGSQKYPISDPFVTLLKTSMPTFLNAITYPDKTMYPVGSSNYQDFYNLSDVYLDTCFAPLLTKETFEREGWRYEINDKGELTFQGIVLNEMKGVYSDVERYVVDDGLMSEIYPDNEYQYISGGDPDKIPSLTYEHYLNFYKQKYHPANALIMIYGHMSDEEEQKYLLNIEEYLNKFDPSDRLDIVIKAKDYPSRRLVTKTYQASEESNKVFSSIVYRFNTSLEASIISLMLEYYLNDTRECYKEIMATGFVERFTGIGVETDLYQPFLNISMELKEKGKTGAIRSIFEKHIQQTIEKSFDKEYILGLINRMEFAFIESLDNNGFGIINEFARRYGKNEDFLDIDYNQILEEVKMIVTDSTKLKKYLKDLILDNINNLICEFLPDQDFNKKMHDKEVLKLNNIYKDLNEEEITEIKQKTELIKQGFEEDESVIPRLTLSDLPPKLDLKNVKVTKEQQYSIVTVDGLEKLTSTISLVFKADKSFKLENLGYLELFFSKFFTFGTVSYSQDELEIKLKQLLGNYSSSVNMRFDEEIFANINFSYLKENENEVLSLISELFDKRHCDTPELLKNMIDSSLSQIQYTMKNESDEILSEKLNMSMYKTRYYDFNSMEAQEKFLQQKQLELQENFEILFEKMEHSFEKFFNNSEFSASILSIDNLDNVTKFVQDIAKKFNTKTLQPKKLDYVLNEFPKEIIKFQSNETVNYHRQAINTEGLSIPIGELYLMCRIMTYEYGWKEVRTKGGAYGVRLNYNEPNGLITALTYRDPRIEENYNLIENSLKFITNLNLDENAFQSFKIATLNSYMPFRNPERMFYFLTKNYYSNRNDNLHLNNIYKEIINADIKNLQKNAQLILDTYKPIKGVSLKLKV